MKEGKLENNPISSSPVKPSETVFFDIYEAPIVGILRANINEEMSGKPQNSELIKIDESENSEIMRSKNQ